MSKRTKEVLNGPHEKIGISTLLPSVATARLVSAAQKCRELPIGSIPRKKMLDKAIEEARAMCPQAFRRSDDTSGCEPKRNPGR